MSSTRSSTNIYVTFCVFLWQTALRVVVEHPKKQCKTDKKLNNFLKIKFRNLIGLILLLCVSFIEKKIVYAISSCWNKLKQLLVLQNLFENEKSYKKVAKIFNFWYFAETFWNSTGFVLLLNLSCTTNFVLM